MFLLFYGIADTVKQQNTPFLPITWGKKGSSI
jgi:hypothetical protein